MLLPITLSKARHRMLARRMSISHSAAGQRIREKAKGELHRHSSALSLHCHCSYFLSPERVLLTYFEASPLGEVHSQLAGALQ